ncbi:unnamed protein product [Cuscuta campestris]|uniref:Myb-like domain-containing protein n=1 Tax=Cuscuta campestris TaxID=132261 RepID=A0A484N4F1_9ASTE|nr:unnamed protein product [Cuscuta campestris]
MERGSRRTRSQAAPDWTAQESLTLVNEVKAVEAECGGTMSSFQKWQLTVAHCNALDVNRSMNQCKRKWESLLDDYRKAKKWESQYGTVSFDDERRTDLGLPGDFCLELFEAIDAYVKKIQGKEASGVDTDPDSDPEAQFDDSIFLESGSKKQRRRSNNENHRAEETALPGIGLDEKPKLPKIQQETNYEPSLLVLDDKAKSPENRDENMEVAEQVPCEGEKGMAALLTLHKNAQLINAVVEGELKYAAADHTDLVRLQADQLIDCLGTISETLCQLCEMVQQCK